MTVTTVPEKNRSERVRRILKRTGIGFAALLVALIGVISFFSWRTESDIQEFRDSVASVGGDNLSVAYNSADLDDLPEPVQRYFEFTFVGPQQPVAYAEVTMAGDFRLPMAESFNPTTAEQTVAVGTPALTFSARTTVFPGFWARAYDHYAEGDMEMKAKVLSTVTVVDESETPELNQTSLQRWLLESPLYPAAMLPGGPVHWESVDATHARAIVAADGLEASLLATFAEDGSLVSFEAEQDGDLTTPYHGSGEHVARWDYRDVDGTMVPHRFEISRAANGEIFPFWTGEVETITFHNA